jgi:murein DD-endopeptidase MepM/ murein hydrolase activator NlpD
MMLKNRLGKILLLAGISLCCVVLLEAGQEMVTALDLKGNPAASYAPETPVVIAPPVAPQAVAPSLDPALKFDVQPKDVSSAQPKATTPKKQPLAINTGPGAETEQTIANNLPESVATGTWNGASFPVENFQAYTSPFGYRQSPDGGYSQEFHYGLDMAAPEGSYIRNWWGGKVVEVSDDSNCGTSVVLESGPWLHIYCHMRGHVETESGKRYMIDREGGLQIWEGQQLPAGARIGRVGMTGRTTGPHLHWGLKYDSNWVDPALVLRAMYFNQQQTASQPTAEAVQ